MQLRLQSTDTRDVSPQDMPPANNLLQSEFWARFDLPWHTPYIDPDYFDQGGEWQGPPAARTRELRMNFGTENRQLRKAPTDLQPPDTVIVDLRRTEQDLLSAMRAKTRYNIGVATRRGD